MRTRRHHNNEGRRGIQRGRTVERAERLAQQMGVPCGNVEPWRSAPFRNESIDAYLRGDVTAGKLCELLGIEKIVGIDLINGIANHYEYNPR